MYLPILFYWVILGRIAFLQTRWSPSCWSTFEPCESDCLLAVFQLNDRTAVLFYTEHFLELRMDRLTISRFRRHSQLVSELIANETCNLFSFIGSEILFRCGGGTTTDDFYLYTHQNQSAGKLSLTSEEIQTFNVLANETSFVFRTASWVTIISPGAYSLCKNCETCDVLHSENCDRHEADFLTLFHLKHTKGVFLLQDGLIYFGSDYLLLVRLNQNADSDGDEPYEEADDEDENRRRNPRRNPEENPYPENLEENPEENPHPEVGRLFSDESNQSPENQSTTRYDDYTPQSNTTKPHIQRSTPMASSDMIRLLLEKISKDRKSVRKYFYKHLFGCTVIRTRPDYRLPLRENLPAYHRSQRIYLTDDLFRSSVTCYYWLVLFLIAFLLITRLLNSGLIEQLERSLYRENISDLDRLFIQLRTEIENGVLRKLEPTDLSRELSNRPSEMRILIDTLLHEQLFVNALNLDARRSVDLVRHLINEVCETIKLRRSDKSTERVAKKFMNLAL